MSPPRLDLLWLQGITCNGNAHSFFNAPSLPLLLERFRLLYHPLLPSHFSLEEIARRTMPVEILVIEGALRKRGYPRGGVEAMALIERYARQARHIVCVGNCAAFGGLFAQSDPAEIRGALWGPEGREGWLGAFERKIINLPGCPIHPLWLVFVLTMLAEGRVPALDGYRRPLELYDATVHEGCVRNEYFEWKVDARDFGRREGCLFYGQGCQAPYTHGSCNRILWNGASSKTRVGMPCVGCTEPDFPRGGLLRTETLMSIPARLPLEVPKRAYLTMTGMAKAFRIPRLHRRRFEEGEGE